VGLCSASHDEPLSQRQIERLRALRLAHLRVDVRFEAADALTLTLPPFAVLTLDKQPT
jgi:hypothetical protein